MNRLVALFMLLVVAAGSAHSRDLTPALQKKFKRIEAEVSKPAKAKLTAASWQVWPKLKPSPTPEEIDAAGQTAAVGVYPVLSKAPVGDLDAVVCIVLMATSDEAQKDLRDVLAQLDAINKAKRRLRDELAKLKDAEATAKEKLKHDYEDRKVTSPTGFFYYKAPKPFPFPPDLTKLTKAEIDTIKSQVKNELDSMSEMGEMESLRLQMAMDRVSKFMTALSNILKKASDTDSQIVKNLK